MRYLSLTPLLLFCAVDAHAAVDLKANETPLNTPAGSQSDSTTAGRLSAGACRATDGGRFRPKFATAIACRE